jgi:phenylacetate-CoA ligase
MNPRPLTSTLVGKVIYPVWTMRDHPAYRRYRRMFNRTQHLSRSALEELQSVLLRTQLVHAYRNVPFYRRRMSDLGLTPLDVRSTRDLKLLPVLTKRDIQHHMRELLAQNVPVTHRSRNQTGGSTGSPLQFWVDKERFDSRRASTDRHNAWADMHPGDWCAELWGARLDTGDGTLPRIGWRQHLLYRTLTLNTSLISPGDLDAYTALLRRFRPRHMVAYAQSAVLFAQHCRQAGADDISFDSIITTAEVLLPAQRCLLEETFGGRVFNRYGCRELSVIASECDSHSGMHINADALIVEIEPDADLPDGAGRVIVTDLFNRSMPLIRYEVGDLANWTPAGPCGCGRNLPRLDRIEGRITDFLSMPDGSKISGPSLTLVISDMADIRQAQFVQPDPSHVLVKVVPGDSFGQQTILELRRRLDSYVKGLVELSVSCVDSIPSEPSGKYRFVKSDLAQAALTASD